ncbi:MAG: DUF4294 domain-containing protein [Flavobacteriaceae bacterium]|nr:DUF4294 domain-containing protein [Flavobacteriaceae bacterium]
MPKSYNIVLFCLLFSVLQLNAQQKKSEHIPFVFYSIEKDNSLCVHLPTVIITPHGAKMVITKRPPRKYRKGTRAYNRTIRNLKVVYPLAKKAAFKIKEIEEKLAKIADKKEKKHLVKEEYQKLMQIYKEPLKNLKISQGRMLIVLIDRETGNTTFQHIKNYKGGVTAFFWQGIARIFGNDLKKGYDPYGEHIYLEHLIQKYERGEL